MPAISVLMNTARSGYSIYGLPKTHYLEYTIDSLRKQSFQDFEFVISDYLYEQRSREINLKSIKPTSFPVYHVPVTHSRFKDLGYSAISACKNNGIFYASGQILVFLDDCCSFESDYLSRIYDIITNKQLFPNPLHMKYIADKPQLLSNGNPMMDCRFSLFNRQQLYVLNPTEPIDIIVNKFHLYGYMTCTLESAIRLNGFDEMFDGSRQLEDVDFGERLKVAGYKISLHKDLFVTEQKHYDNRLDPLSMFSKNFGVSLKCNGQWYKIKENRKGEDWIRVNHRALNQVEKDTLINFCNYRSETQDPKRPRCNMSGGGCNWRKEGKVYFHMQHPDSQIYINNPSVFDMSEIRTKRLKTKEEYRVL
jgi:glycosyltransferase involved in cell wall biosynthesis